MNDQPEDPPEPSPERVKPDGVRIRPPSPRSPSNLATYAVIGVAIVFGGLLLLGRGPIVGDTAATGDPAASTTAELATASPDETPTPTESDSTPIATPLATEPDRTFPDPTMRPASTNEPGPTRGPASPKPTLDPLDPPDVTPTPPPSESYRVTLVDRCLDVNGDEQVMVQLEWVSASPPITEITFFMDGAQFGDTSGFSEVNGSGASSYPLTIGTTHVGGGKFHASGGLVTGLIESAPMTVEAGVPCPIG